MRIALALFALAGCVGSPPGRNASADTGPTETLGQYRVALERAEAPFHAPGAVTARLGEEVQLGDLRVRPVELVEDSRCPIDATCVWAGRIRLRVAIGGAGEQVMEIDRPVSVTGGQRLVLTGAWPPNWSSPPAGVDPNEPKRFAFRLAGAG
jgi:hypothetical protein